ncbi:MAG: hypothetical protein JNK64_30700 [Myxococcales bacterium]|nr:hypothetical protein [Myxococcales bacterium]
MKRLALLTLLLLAAPACTIYLDDPAHDDDPGVPDAQPWVPDDARELDAVTPWPHDDAPPYVPDAQPWPPEDAPPGCGLDAGPGPVFPDAGPGPGLPDAGPGPGLPDAQPWPQPDAQPYP